MKILRYLLLMLVMPMAGCILVPPTARGVYIAPHGACGYVVAMGTDSNIDINISNCMPLDAATRLAESVNRDMAGHWSSPGPQ
jgi:hypothetical protein